MKKPLYFLQILFFLLVLSVPEISEGALQRRAIIDVGSGAIKMKIADVDTETNIIQEYVSTNKFLPENVIF